MLFIGMVLGGAHSNIELLVVRVYSDVVCLWV